MMSFNSAQQNNNPSAQFAALNKQTLCHQNDAKTADRARKLEVDMLNRLNERRQHDEKEHRIAHGQVAEETRREKILENEAKQFKQGMNADRQDIVLITSEVKGKEVDFKEQKQLFVKEIDSASNECDILLAQRDNKATIQLLEAEEVNWLVEDKLEALANRNDGELPQDAEGNWNEIAAQSKEVLANIIEIDEKGGAEMNEERQLEHFLQQLRSKFASENGNIDEMQMKELEAKWDDSMEEGGGRNASSGVPGATPHMELFYHHEEEEYSGAVHDVSAANNIGQAC